MNMGIKIILLLLILILFAALLFTVAGFLLSAPELLIGPMHTVIASGCIIAGAVIVHPLVIFAFISLLNRFFSLERKKKSRKGK